MIFDVLILQDSFLQQYRFFYSDIPNHYDDLYSYIRSVSESHTENYNIRLVRFASLDTCEDPSARNYFISIWNCTCENYEEAFSYLWDNYSKSF